MYVCDDCKQIVLLLVECHKYNLFDTKHEHSDV